MVTNRKLSINNGNNSLIINQQWQQIANYQSTMATNRQLSINNGNKSPIINQQWQQISNFLLTMATNCQFINNGNQLPIYQQWQPIYVEP